MVDNVLQVADRFNKRRQEHLDAKTAEAERQRADNNTPDPAATEPVNRRLVHDQLGDTIAMIMAALRVLGNLGINRKTFDRQTDGLEKAVDEVGRWCPRPLGSESEGRLMVMARPEQVQAKNELMDKLHAFARSVFEAGALANDRQRVMFAVDILADSAAPALVAFGVAAGDEQQAALAHANREATLTRVQQCRESLDQAANEIASANFDAAREFIAQAEAEVRA